MKPPFGVKVLNQTWAPCTVVRSGRAFRAPRVYQGPVRAQIVWGQSLARSRPRSGWRHPLGRDQGEPGPDFTALGVHLWAFL